MRVLATLVVMTAFAGPVHAEGINLAWDRCWADGGTMLRTSTCTSNDGSQSMVGSFELLATQTEFVGTEIIVDACSMGEPFPSWWHFFNPGSCRQTSLSASASFVTDPPANCVDPWLGQAGGGLAAYFMFYGAWDNVRLIMGFAVANAVPLPANVEFQCFRLTIDNRRTVDAGACAGCDVPVCVALNEIKAVQADGSFQRLTAAMPNQLVAWQERSKDCEAGFIVPVRNITWGRVKSLYR